MLRAFEDGPAVDNVLWTAADSAWATRVAAEADTAAPSRPSRPAAWLGARAAAALQRLQPRAPAVARLLASGTQLGGPLLLAALAGLAVGLAADVLGGAQRINLLAPPVWALLLWNVAVYVGMALLALRARGGRTPWAGSPARLARWWLGRGATRAGRRDAPLQAWAALWAPLAAPLLAARAAALLHVGAAALAAGVIAGMYLRGLVLDFRAGWQSTFLDAEQVHTLLSALLGPAAGLSGIALPDAAGVAVLQLGPAAVATAPAADWIHLYALTLTAVVVLPRLLLAVAAAAQARWRAGRLVLPLHEPYFQRLLLARAGSDAVVQVHPHAVAAGAQAVLGLRAALVAVLGDRLTLQVTAPVAYGDEDAPAALAPGAGTATSAAPTLRIALVDLAATPEAEVHGRFLEMLSRGLSRGLASGLSNRLSSGLSRGPAAGGNGDADADAVPLLLVADATHFRRRFGGLPQREAERAAAWQALARQHGLGALVIDLEQPDLKAAADALTTLLQGAPR